MLKENFRVHEIPVGWLDSTYDLQRIFNMQTDDSTKQRSLEYAMEHFGIDMNLPAHDALNDALFTARVAQKLNIAEGIRVADAKTGDHLFEAVLGDADSGERGFPTPERAVAVSEVTAPVCPTCKKPLLQKEPLLHAKGQKYQALFACEEHGEMMMCAAVKRNINETFRVRVILMRPDEERLTRYREKLANEKEFRRARRRPRSRRSGKKTATPATTE